MCLDAQDFWSLKAMFQELRSGKMALWELEAWTFEVSSHSKRTKTGSGLWL